MKWEAATVTTGNVSATVNTMHGLDIDGMTAARDFVLPTAASTGDRVGVFCTTDAPTTVDYVLQIKSGAAGDLINGTDHSSTIWSALLIKGECLIFRCIDGSTVDWIVEYDGRIPMHGSAAGVQTVTSSGSYVTVDFSALTVKANVGNIIDSTNDRIYARRAANFLLTTFLAYSASGTGKSAICQWRTSAPAGIGGTAMGSQSVQAGTFSVSSSVVQNIASGDYVDTQIWQNDSTSESCTVSTYALEVL
ncbi:MAG: hypothetical protein IPH85_13645 [Ignavibacteria bacterium]|nr:hypothetical protein [Ignavibacteria bacterium]